MHPMLSSLCLIIIFSLAPFCHCKEDFAIIFSNHEEIWLQKSINPCLARKIAKFPDRVTALAIHQGYIFVSGSVNYFNRKLSTVWRSKVEDSSAHPTIVWDEDNESWETFAGPLCNGEVLCMVGAKGYMYIGISNGNIWRRPMNTRQGWRRLHRGSIPVTGMDYNHTDGKIYASLESGSILRCSRKRSACQEIYRIRGRLSSLKVAFGAVWSGVNGTQLWKCSLDRVHDTYVYYEYGCDLFGNYRNPIAEIMSIDASEKYIYVNVDKAKTISRWNPKKRTCKDAIFKVHGMEQFIIVDKDLM